MLPDNESSSINHDSHSGKTEESTTKGYETQITTKQVRTSSAEGKETKSEDDSKGRTIKNGKDVPSGEGHGVSLFDGSKTLMISLIAWYCSKELNVYF